MSGHGVPFLDILADVVIDFIVRHFQSVNEQIENLLVIGQTPRKVQEHAGRQRWATTGSN